jgi:hypothetical protein
MGTVMLGDLVWLTDDAIPTYGTTSFTQIIVSAPTVAMVLCEGEAITSVFPETKATELGVVHRTRPRQSRRNEPDRLPLAARYLSVPWLWTCVTR